MKFRILAAIVFCLASSWCSNGHAQEVKSIQEITGIPKRIAFGSCGHQDKRQPVLEQVVAQKPDLFVYLGDNIYGDTRDMRVLKAKYDRLGSKEEFQALRKNVAVLSIWDDHDYGENDSGKEYPKKEESREIFFEFWRVPQDSPRRTHPGIYGSHIFEQDGKRLQVILLDTRTFRDPLKRNKAIIDPRTGFKNDYQPDADPAKTLLGAEQWAWLKSEFEKPADLRIVASSIQFGHEYNGYESWTNLPLEQQKMFDLIKETKANGVVFISGDVHWAEISKREVDGGYPIYDVTASGITEEWSKVEPSQFRVGEAFRDNHFGQIDIDWESPELTLTLRIVNKMGEFVREHQVSGSSLKF